MRHILRRRELTEDEWRYLGENGPAGAALIVPLSQLHGDPERWRQHAGPLCAEPLENGFLFPAYASHHPLPL